MNVGAARLGPRRDGADIVRQGRGLPRGSWHAWGGGSPGSHSGPLVRGTCSGSGRGIPGMDTPGAACQIPGRQ